MQTLVEELPDIAADGAVTEGGNHPSEVRDPALGLSGRAGEGACDEQLADAAEGGIDTAVEQGAADAAREAAVASPQQPQQALVEHQAPGRVDGDPADAAATAAEGSAELAELSELQRAIEQVHNPASFGRASRVKDSGDGGSSQVWYWFKSGLGSLVVAAVVLGGLLHGSYMLRQQLLEVPVLYDWLNFMCGLYDCQLETQQSYEVIHVEERWLNEHPHRDDALQLGAMLAHTGKRRLPYPDIELILRDLDGHVTHQGQVTPQDYVADSRQRSRIYKGIEPGSMVPVRIDLPAPQGGAESFRIMFHPPHREG